MEDTLSITDDGKIFQVQNGQPQQVVYGGKHLTAYGTMTGKRLAALIRLKEQARRVLASQNPPYAQYRKVPRRP